MNPRTTAPSRPGPATTVGAVPPELAALAAGVAAAVVLAVLGVATLVVLGLAAIAASVTGLTVAARRIGEEWIRGGDDTAGG